MAEKRAEQTGSLGHAGREPQRARYLPPPFMGSRG